MARRKDPVPSWTWMLFGLSLGLIVALAVYLRSLPPRPSAAPAVPAATVAAPDREPAETEDSASEAADARFDFYEILPKFEVVVPEGETATRPSRETAAVDRPGSYILQAGSFRDAADADQRRANLALLGIESWIERARVDDVDYHRVRIGPVSDLGELNRLRRRLADARIETMLQVAAE